MRPLVAPLAIVLLLATSLAAAEIPIAPDTNVLRFTGFGASVASHGSDVVAVWTSNELRSLFATRLDTNGAPVGNGHPLPAFWSSLTGVAWASRHFIVAGSDVTRGISALAVDADGQVTLAPRVIAPVDFGGQITVTSNGSLVLVTYVSQTLNTQTLFGVVIDADLHVLHEKFVIDTRELPSSLDHNLQITAAADGSDFLIAWEQPASPRKLTLKRVTVGGEVLDGPSIESDKDILFPAVAPGLLVWWNREQIVARGLAGGEPVVLATVNAVRAIDAAASDGRIAVAWMQRLAQSCRLISSDQIVFARVYDAAFSPLGDFFVVDPSAGEFSLVDTTIAAGSPIAVWQHADCAVPFESVRAARIGTGAPAEISRAVGPSLQSTPDVATDGGTFVAVWAEQRDNDTTQRVYAAGVGEDGRPLTASALVSVSAAAESPRIAAGGGRFLAVWYEGALLARFLRADGTPDGDAFILGYGRGARIVWDGARFVVAYNQNNPENGVRAVEVSLSGERKELGVVSGGAIGTVADLAVGPGEVMALIQAVSAERVVLEAAPLRGTSWGEPSTLATISRPCQSLSCIDYYGVAIAWNGTAYLAVYVESAGPGRGGVLRTRRIAAGGVPLDEQPGKILSLANQYNVTGRLLWTGTEFVIVLRASQLASSSDNLFRFRLTAGGMPLDSVIFPPALVPGGVNTEVSSAFGAVLVSPSRALVVYAKSTQSVFGARVYATTTDFAALPKQRAAGRH